MSALREIAGEPVMVVPDSTVEWAQLDPSTVERGSVGFVWGNCQAESIRRMIAPTGVENGVRFVRLPPVFEMSADDVDRLHALLPLAGVLVTQPVKDEYRIPGCGSQQLIGLLAPSARVVTVPTTYYEGLFPWQVHAHDAAGARVDAPVVDYHDLRLLDAAVRGWDVARAVQRIEDTEAPATAVQDVAAASIAELRRRNAELDVDTADAVLGAGPEAMWTVNHPANPVLAALGEQVLGALGWSGEPAVPDHEMLGRIRAPLPSAVLTALDLPATAARSTWLVDDAVIDWTTVATAALELYRRSPGIAERAVERYRDRLTALQGY